jgi:hypothetical protein
MNQAMIAALKKQPQLPKSLFESASSVSIYFGNDKRDYC